MDDKHVLIVDDEPKVAFFLSKALERSQQSYQISLAQSGEEALEILDETSIDLLVTDLRMPGISGLELIRWVKAATPDTRTILITAYGSDDVEAEARRLEAYRYITKPFDIGDFTQAVQQAFKDVAVSQPGITILSDETFEAMTEALDNLRQEVGARCIFLADMQGQCLAQVGYSENIRTSTLLALLAGGFATTGELGRQFGDGEAVNLNFHEGSRYEIYSANVGENMFIALLYDQRQQKSRIGIVWLYTRRVIEHLLSILSTAKHEVLQPDEVFDPDFGTSLDSELDNLFGGGESEPSESGGGFTAGMEMERDKVPTRASPPNGRSSSRSPSKPDRPQSKQPDRSRPSPGGKDQPQDDEGLFSLEEALRQGLIDQAMFDRLSD